MANISEKAIISSDALGCIANKGFGSGIQDEIRENLNIF